MTRDSRYLTDAALDEFIAETIDGRFEHLSEIHANSSLQTKNGLQAHLESNHPKKGP